MVPTLQHNDPTTVGGAYIGYAEISRPQASAVCQPASTIQMILSPAEETLFLLLDKQPALFSAAAQKLYALNDVAALIWCCLEKREPTSIIADRLIGRGVSQADADTYVHDALRRWLKLGLLQLELKSLDGVVFAQSFNVSLGRLAWTIQVTSDDLAYSLLQLFSNYDPLKDSGNVIKVIEANAQIYVFHNEKHVLSCVAGEIVPSIKAYLTGQVLQQCFPDIAFHAACMMRGTKSLILSGGPGAGKTTLALHLIEKGFGYCGDDIVLISSDGRVTGIPFALTIKSGTSQILRKSRPELADLAVHRRPDSKRVRYYNPVNMARAGRADPVGWLVFIKRRHGENGKLIPLTQFEALRRLVENSFSSDGCMNNAMLSSIKHLITTANSYELSYSKANDAVDLLSAMCDANF
jgi:hypothetical protein